MLPTERATHYDILDIKPDATQNQVREAYLRAKAAYHKESAALYALISPEEREHMVNLLEQAYKTLSNPERRREYDQEHGFISTENPKERPTTSAFRAPTIIRSETMPRAEQPAGAESPENNVISIDRVPPMESGESFLNEDILVAPSTMPSTAIVEPPSPTPTRIASVASPISLQNWTDSSPSKSPPSRRKNDPRSNLVPLQNEIEIETEWSGAFIRRIREANSVSIEEIASITRVSKHYLVAIEEENFAKLPAPVYVRGFITQLSKTLKLPTEKMVNAYMSRMNRQQEKSSK
jgi:curved DNA-binding protein CbpA